MSNMSSGVRIKLSAMMFLQYAIHAIWFMQMGAYLGGKLNCTGGQISWVQATAPLGALLAPIFMGVFADRLFAGEKLLAVLNLAGGALLFVAAQMQDPTMLFVILLIQQLCYMPTWAITNSIAIANAEDTEKDLPAIRVFGSIGWVATGLFGVIALNVFKTRVDGTATPIIAAGVLSLIAGILAFVLPHTPPAGAGKKVDVGDILGLKAMALMKNFSFAIFILVSLVIMIPFAAYWTFFSLYLASLGVPLISGTMHLGQFVEIFVMWLLLPIALKKLGVKWTMVVGVAVMGLRYVMFMYGDGGPMMFLNYGGILVHGFIFSFFFVTGYIYSDRVAPKDMRAQAQALIMLVTFGAGMLLGNYVNGKIVDENAILGENVAKEYSIPADLPTEASLTIEGAEVADTVVYNRALNDNEFTLLVAMQQKKDVLVERLKKELGDKAKLDDGKLDAPAAAKALTISTWLTLAKPEEDAKDAKAPSGSIYKVGEGDSALELTLDEGKLSLKAGDAKMTQIAPLATGDKVHIAATFDGKLLKLYTGGAVYKRWNWRKVWTYPAIITGILLVLMIVFFHTPKDEAEAAEEPAEAPAEEEAPAEGAASDEADEEPKAGA